MLSLFFVVMAMSLFLSMDFFLTSFVFFIMVPLTLLNSVGEASYVLMMESELSVVMVMLTLWISGWGMLADPYTEHRPVQVKGAVCFLVFLLLVCFFSMNGVIFYMGFEACLGPTSYLVLLWGYTPERIEAVVYMILYTLGAGNLHMHSLVMMDLFLGSPSFLSCVNTIHLQSCDDGLFCTMWWICLVCPFFVKAPAYGFHLWLPKAHVEASTVGSMLLAAVMLKVGVFGMVRYSVIFIPPEGWVLPFQGLAVFGGVASSLVALRQVDIKGMIAYSSVSHMSFTMAGLMVYSESSNYGVTCMMVSHGLSSSGLFAWAGIIYEKLGTRNLFVVSGLRGYSPAMSNIFKALLVANAGMPPMFNFWGEYFLFGSVYAYCPLLGVWMGIGMILGMAYTLYIFIVTQRGKYPALTKDLHYPIYPRELDIMAGHLLPLILLFFYPWVF